LKKNKEGEFPGYIPFYYKMFCKIRKLKRQTCVRLNENIAAKKGPVDIIPEGISVFTSPSSLSKVNPREAINKSGMWLEEDLSSPEIKKVADKIESLKGLLRSKNLRYTSTAGMFIVRMYTPVSEKRKLWENAWVCYHSQVKAGHRVLDLGGASTAFIFYLASLGCSVKVIDNDWSCCGTIYNTNYVARKMKWDLEALDRDIARPIPFPEASFDRIFSICTVEHLSSSVRRSMMKEVRRVLKPGGIVGLTLDYDHSRKVLIADKGLRFGYRQKLFEEIINPSGLSLYGNVELIDFASDEDFIGTLFLKK
jgi:SAM-dependent methyltransferase